MAFRPMNPLPTPDEVLERLDPKPGERYGFITREDVQFGWIYFLSLMHGGVSQTPGPAAVQVWNLTESYPPGTLVQYQNTVYVANQSIPSLGPVPGTDPRMWRPVGQTPKVSVALASGQDPSNFAFTGLSQQGDVLFNLPDKYTWIYGPQGWQEVLVPPVDSVFGGMLVNAAMTANQFQPATLPPNDPTNPGTYYVAAEDVLIPNNFPTAALRGVTVAAGDWLVDDGNAWVHISMNSATQTLVTTDTAGETPATWTFGTAPVNGDVFANTADNRAWFRMPDPAAPATSIWVEITTTPNTVTTTSTAGEAPATHTFNTPPVVGDLFLNTKDEMSWVYGPTSPSNPARIWHPLGQSPTITLSTTAGETPTAPGTTVLQPPKTGDWFLNIADNSVWVCLPDPAGTGVVWQMLPVSGGGGGQWFIGTDDPPAATLGVDGDFYLNSDTHAVAQKRPGGQWEVVGPGPGADGYLSMLTLEQMYEVLSATQSPGRTFIGRAAPVGNGTPSKYDTWVVTPAVIGATVGSPGDWVPAGAPVPVTLAEVQAFRPTAVPATAWTTGQHMLLADGTTMIHWNGTTWVAGGAP